MNLSLLTLIIQIVSFLILVGVLTKVLYRPLLDFLDKRSKKVQDILDDAKRERKQAEDELKKSEERLKKTKEDILKLKELAELQADEHKQKIIQDAEKEARDIRIRSREDIERQIKEVKEEIKKEIGTLAVSIAEKILDKEIKEEDHKRLIEESIKDLSKER